MGHGAFASLNVAPLICAGLFCKDWSGVDFKNPKLTN